MTAHRHKGDLDSKPRREIFLTSTSLSFSSLASSTTWDDAIERNTKESTTTEPNGEFSKGSSKGSEMQANVTTQPGPSPASKLRPVHQTRQNGFEPNRIPPSVFAKTADVDWSEVSNESLFSLKIDGFKMPNTQGLRQSNLKPEKVLMSGEFLAYSPVLSVKLEDAVELITDVEEIKTEKTNVTPAETRSHEEKPSSSAPIILWTPNPSEYCLLDRARPKKGKSSSLLKKRKKIKKNKKKKDKNKKKEKKKKDKEEKKDKKEKKEDKKDKNKEKKDKNKCCIWSWSCSRFSKSWSCPKFSKPWSCSRFSKPWSCPRFSKCKVNLCCCFKWRNCCCCSCFKKTKKA